MFVDVTTDDGFITVKLDNIFFERLFQGGIDCVRMSVIGHKDYWCKQPGIHESWENKAYDYHISWREFNRIRSCMGLEPEHLRSCKFDEYMGSCECVEDGVSQIDTKEFNAIKEKARLYTREHPAQLGEEDSND